MRATKGREDSLEETEAPWERGGALSLEAHLPRGVFRSSSRCQCLWDPAFPPLSPQSPLLSAYLEFWVLFWARLSCPVFPVWVKGALP